MIYIYICKLHSIPNPSNSGPIGGLAVFVGELRPQEIRHENPCLLLIPHRIHVIIVYLPTFTIKFNQM